MRHKHGKWYADWRDEHGRRRMKAFPTKKQAQQYTAKMRRLVAEKKARASAPSPTGARLGPRHTRTKGEQTGESHGK